MIAGLQKMTLLDYPGKVACTVFLQGCNFRCPFCHNSSLLGKAQEPPIPREELMAFLKKRAGLLDGVCITGGEPTLQKELPSLLQDIKALGYAVKLDTNGYRPDILKELASQNLIDYVAMDIKNCPARYAETAGLPGLDLTKIEESMTFLIHGSLPYEFRTTVTAQHHTVENIQAIGQWFRELGQDTTVQNYFLQPYTDRNSVLCGGLSAPNPLQLQDFLAAISPFVHNVEIRGMQS